MIDIFRAKQRESLEEERDGIAFARSCIIARTPLLFYDCGIDGKK